MSLGGAEIWEPDHAGSGMIRTNDGEPENMSDELVVLVAESLSIVHCYTSMLPSILCHPGPASPSVTLN